MKQEEEASLLISGPTRVEYAGRDVTAWRWFVSGHEVIVEISGTAMEADGLYLSDRVLDAKATMGASEIRRMIDWDVPNPLVSLSTDD
jgi:hypothetical protein